MTTQTSIFHFSITSVQPVKELEAKLYEMRHVPTGAKLVWLNRVSDNKTFAVAFPTIPENDTGVFHILEHSVLCGSEKYPVKEPFVELMKSSMQTFLNAMTFPDKTCYPVSSRNDKDFINLIRVYLDAVFFPSIYEKPEIFWQEGWHYELRDGQQPAYTGVVFNEMKGALASPDATMRNEINRLMFPDTCYRFISGGDPAHIPELSYEQFLASHQRFYHPSNAYLFLDGSVDLEAVLKIIDEEYLSRFDFRKMDTRIPMQKPVAAGKRTCHYEISPAESLQKKARTAWAFGMGTYENTLELTAMQALAQLLSGSNQAPLKQKLLQQGLAEDASLSVDSGLQQNKVIVSVEHFAEAREQEIHQLLMDTLRQQIEGGLDRSYLRAILANMEFRERERDYGPMPQGLGLAMSVMESWLYGGDPAANLSVGPLFEQLNSLVDTGWYERLLEKVFFHNQHTCQVLLLPSHTVGQEKTASENARLAKDQKSWDKALLLSQKERLDTWQASTDSPEVLAMLPQLALSDISKKPEDIPTEERTVDGVTVLQHPLSTGGISYWNLYFDISDLDEAAISRVSLLRWLLSRLGTRQTDALELQKKLHMTLGNLRMDVTPYSSKNVAEVCRSFLRVSFSALEQKLPQAVALILELLRETDFSDIQQLQAILQQTRTQMEQSIVSSGHQIGMLRTLAGVSAEGVVREYVDGFSFLQALKAMRAEELSESLKNICSKIFDGSRLTVSITGEPQDGALEQLLSGLPRTENTSCLCAVKPWGIQKEGIIIPAGISFAVQGGKCAYSGQMQVAAQIASLAHLWNTVRVQGGAYGAGLSISDNGCGFFYSYRDPNPARSLEQYEKTPEFIQAFAAEKPDLTGFIIGTITGTEPVLLPGKMGSLADSWYFKGVDYADRCRSRKEMLSITAKELAALQGSLYSFCENGSICVVGSKAHVEDCGLNVVYTL